MAQNYTCGVPGQKWTLKTLHKKVCKLSKKHLKSSYTLCEQMQYPFSPKQ